MGKRRVVWAGNGLSLGSHFQGTVWQLPLFEVDTNNDTVSSYPTNSRPLCAEALNAAASGQGEGSLATLQSLGAFPSSPWKVQEGCGSLQVLEEEN